MSLEPSSQAYLEAIENDAMENNPENVGSKVFAAEATYGLGTSEKIAAGNGKAEDNEEHGTEIKAKT